MKKARTKSAEETQNLGGRLARGILKSKLQNRLTGGAVVLALEGDLGGGKTTFLQGFANDLGIKEKILSPTFVIQKRFDINKNNFKNFYHIDCYRLKDEKDILELDFKNIIKNPENIVAIEWPERIKKIMPENAIAIEFKFIDEQTRELTIKSDVLICE